VQKNIQSGRNPLDITGITPCSNNKEIYNVVVYLSHVHPCSSKVTDI